MVFLVIHVFCTASIIPLAILAIRREVERARPRRSETCERPPVDIVAFAGRRSVPPPARGTRAKPVRSPRLRAITDLSA